MIITEATLRKLIRKIILERKTSSRLPIGRSEEGPGPYILGEPDATGEPERQTPAIHQVEDEDEIDEISTVGAIGVGGSGEASGDLSGFVIPMGRSDKKKK